MKMKKIILFMAALMVLTIPVCAGVKEIGTVNGLRIVRIKTMGVFAPSSTTVIYYDPAKPGTIEGVLNHAGGPGILPAVATAGGVAGGAALLRPARTEVNQSGGNATSSSTASGSGNATGGNGHTPPPATPGWIPPGHR